MRCLLAVISDYVKFSYHRLFSRMVTEDHRGEHSGKRGYLDTLLLFSDMYEPRSVESSPKFMSEAPLRVPLSHFLEI